MKILLVEDQQELRSLVKRYLESNGYVVEEAEDGEVALEMISVHSYDCLILDLNLPKVDGMEVALSVKKRGLDLPIIMLTARSQIYDKLEGFDSGADDYVTKPFDMKELLARVNVVSRRGRRKDVFVYTFDGFEVIPEKNILISQDIEIKLSGKEMGILEYLLINQGRVISSEELLEHVWDAEVDMFSSTVKTHLKTLRKKIDPQKKYIKTIRGKGYIYQE